MHTEDITWCTGIRGSLENTAMIVVNVCLVAESGDGGEIRHRYCYLMILNESLMYGESEVLIGLLYRWYMCHIYYPLVCVILLIYNQQYISSYGT